MTIKIPLERDRHYVFSFNHAMRALRAGFVDKGYAYNDDLQEWVSEHNGWFEIIFMESGFEVSDGVRIKIPHACFDDLDAAVLFKLTWI